MSDIDGDDTVLKMMDSIRYSARSQEARLAGRHARHARLAGVKLATLALPSALQETPDFSTLGPLDD